MKKLFLALAILLVYSTNIQGIIEDLCLEPINRCLFKYETTLSSEKKQFYLKQIENRKREGLRALREAKQMSYLIPDIDTQKIVRSAITGAIASMVTKGTAAKALIVALNALGEAAGQYYDNYCAIKEKLAYAKYCSEVVESLKKEMLRLEHSPHVIE